MKRADRQRWLEGDPRRRKWLTQCVTCQSVGRHPDMPQDAFDAQRILRRFVELGLDSAGCCRHCAALDFSRRNQRS